MSTGRGKNREQIVGGNTQESDGTRPVILRGGVTTVIDDGSGYHESVAGRLATQQHTGHGAANHKVLRLHLDQEAFETGVVGGPMRLVNVEGHGEDGVDRVLPDTALEAGAGALAQCALHVTLGNHVLHTRGNVQKAVASDVAKRRPRGPDFRMFEPEFVCLGHSCMTAAINITGCLVSTEAAVADVTAWRASPLTDGRITGWFSGSLTSSPNI